MDNNLELTDILITHHHNDHIGGVSKLKNAFPNVNIFGPSDSRIPANNIVKDEDTIKLDSLNEEFRVLDVRGHTNSHIAYYFHKKLFCGDTLFSCGCGRLFEGTAEDMFSSLNKFISLPEETLVFCAHEYTQSNLNFAVQVEPFNNNLIEYKNKIDKKRLKNEISLPTNLKLEKDINPFLRSHVLEIKENIKDFANINYPTDLETFTAVRSLKDNS